MLYRSIAASTAVIGLLLSQAAYAADDCWSAEEARAAQVQNLNVVLMIEALKCGKTIPAVKANYEAFAAKNQDAIVRSKHVIENYFYDRGGAEGGRSDYLAYETALANELSSPAASYDRCEDMASFTRMAGNAEPADLPALSHMLAASRLIEACPAPVRPMAIDVWKKTAAVDPAPELEPEAAPPPLVAEAAPPAMTEAVETTEIVDGVPTDIPEAPREAVAATPQREARVAVAANEPAADPASALQAAAHALALAADALKNASPRAATAVN